MRKNTLTGANGVEIVLENCSREDLSEKTVSEILSVEYPPDLHTIHVYRNDIVDDDGWSWTKFAVGDRVRLREIESLRPSPSTSADFRLIITKRGKLVEVDPCEHWREQHSKTFTVESISPATYGFLNVTIVDDDGDKSMCYSGDLYHA